MKTFSATGAKPFAADRPNGGRAVGLKARLRFGHVLPALLFAGAVLWTGLFWAGFWAVRLAHAFLR